MARSPLSAGRPARWRRTAFALCLGVVAAACLTGAGGRAAHARGGRAGGLERALRRLVAMPGGPPGVIAVVRRGARYQVYEAGTADLRTGQRLEVTDHMRLASVSKAFSGAIALRLVSRGVLQLDDTIGQVLPWLPRAWAPVTLRELLQHTSGLPDYTASPAFIARVLRAPRAPIAPRRLLAFVAGDPLQFKPGTRYRYDNSDNIVIAMMARQAAHRWYRGLLRAIVYRPLQLLSTHLPVGFRLPRPFMHGYAPVPGHAPEDVSTALSASYAWAAGGMVSTPADLTAFIRAYAGGRFTSPAVRARQLRFVRGSSEPPGPGRNASGLGIFRYSTRCGTVYGHTGNTIGYTQFAAASRNGQDSATLSATAQIGSRSGRLLAAFRDAEAAAVCAALGRP